MIFELDRPSRGVKVVVVERPRGCFRTSGVATETLGRCAKSIIAVGDGGDGPYGRQMAMAVDKVQKTNTVGASPFPSSKGGGWIHWLCHDQCWQE